MRRWLLLLVACCGGCALPEGHAPAAAPAVAAAETAPAGIAGVLSGETRWSGQVLVSGDVLVPAGSRLVIAAGTTVTVRPSESTRIDPEYLAAGTELLVRGTLEVAGTAEHPVRFIPEAGTPDGDSAWAGIELDGAPASRIRGAEIRQAETGILCIGCSPEIVGNHIARSRYGIIVQQGGAPRVLDNRIEQGESGIACWDGSRPYLKGNTVTSQEEEGVLVARGSRPWLDRNTVAGNDIGILLAEPGLPMDRTRVRGNRVDVLVPAGESAP